VLSSPEGSHVEASLSLELDAWAAMFLDPAAARPSALLPAMIDNLRAARSGAAGKEALLAAAATAAAAAAAASGDPQWPPTPAAAGDGARRAGSAPASPDWDATPDAGTIHDGFWEVEVAGQRSSSVATQPSDTPRVWDPTDDAPEMPAAWTSAWARRPGWAGPACLRVSAPVAVLAQTLVRGGGDVDAAAAAAVFDREVAAERALPPRVAASQLLQLHACGLVRRLLALVAGSGDSRHETEWLLSVMQAVAPRLGLLEAGVVLATLQAR
jgi:hypothetical protein